jgi:hypothetical protein
MYKVMLEITQLTFSVPTTCTVQSIQEHMEGYKSKVEVACTAIWSAHDTGYKVQVELMYKLFSSARATL